MNVFLGETILVCFTLMWIWCTILVIVGVMSIITTFLDKIFKRKEE